MSGTQFWEQSKKCQLFFQAKPLQKPLKSALKSTNSSQANYSTAATTQNKVRMADDVSVTESEMCDVPLAQDAKKDDPSSLPEQSAMYAFSRQAIRSNYMDKSIEAKKKVYFMIIYNFC